MCNLLAVSQIEQHFSFFVCLAVVCYSPCVRGKSELVCPHTCLWEWDLMTWLGFGPLGGRGRGELSGGWEIDAPQVFAIRPCPFITTERPCHVFNICMLPIRVSKMIYLRFEDSQAARDSTKARLKHLSRAWDLSQETNKVTIKPLYFFSQHGGGAMQYIIYGFMLM